MNFDEKVEILRSFPAFKVLPIADIRALAFAIKEKQVPEKTVLIYEGTSAESVYLIYSGVFKIYRLSPNGREINLGIAQKRDIIGELAFINMRTRTAFVESMTSAHLFYLKGDDFIRLMRAYPEISMSILDSLAKKIKKADENTSQIMTKSLKERVHETILVISKGYENQEIVITHEELAALLGATRARITEALITLENEGKIINNHKRIKINKIVPSGTEKKQQNP